MIFLNLPAIYAFHEQLLARMQALSKSSPWTMAEVFCDQADVLVDLYGSYCTLHPKSLQALERRMVSKNEAWPSCESVVCPSLSLVIMLIIP